MTFDDYITGVRVAQYPYDGVVIVSELEILEQA